MSAPSSDLVMYVVGGAYFLPCALAAGAGAGLAARRRSILLAVLAIPPLWILTGGVLFAVRYFRIEGIAPSDPRLLQVVLGAVAPVYGLAGLMALITVQRQVPPVPTAVLTFVAGALGCMFVLPAFIASTCSKFGMCP